MDHTKQIVVETMETVSPSLCDAVRECVRAGLSPRQIERLITRKGGSDLLRNGLATVAEYYSQRGGV